MSFSSFRNVIDKMCLEILYLIYMYKEDLALNNQQWLICHKTQPNQIRYIGGNDKIVVLKKTTQHLYFKTFIEKINSGNLIM